jgi:hypothetical protein
VDKRVVRLETIVEIAASTKLIKQEQFRTLSSRRTRRDLLNLLEFSQIAYDTSFIKPKGFELALKNCKSCKTPGFKASAKLHTAQPPQKKTTL